MIRIFDIIFSLIALIILSPVFIIIIILLCFTGEGYVFFLQKRIGFCEKSFNLFKFATMLKNSPNIGSKTVTINNDTRILPVGKFLRKTKINELPQLLNILRGDMSIIGPRPMTKENYLLYDIKVRQTISKMKPGLSGIGSIIFRNEESLLTENNHNINFFKTKITPYKGLVEYWYASKQSTTLYFFLIFITVWVIFNPKSQIIWKYFQTLPKPKGKLKKILNFKS